MGAKQGVLGHVHRGHIVIYSLGCEVSHLGDTRELLAAAFTTETTHNVDNELSSGITEQGHHTNLPPKDTNWGIIVFIYRFAWWDICCLYFCFEAGTLLSFGRLSLAIREGTCIPPLTQPCFHLSGAEVFLSQAGFVCAEMLYAACCNKSPYVVGARGSGRNNCMA